MARPYDMAAFVRESWRIEGLTVDTAAMPELKELHWSFLGLYRVSVDDVIQGALVFTNGYGKMRLSKGMDVMVGSHRPKPGGPEIRDELEEILLDINAGANDPYYNHHAFERLHPFLDGNGRTGRLLWLWEMHQRTRHIPKLGFLHTWYYQSLEHAR